MSVDEACPSWEALRRTRCLVAGPGEEDEDDVPIGDPDDEEGYGDDDDEDPMEVRRR